MPAALGWHSGRGDLDQCPLMPETQDQNVRPGRVLYDKPLFLMEIACPPDLQIFPDEFTHL